MEGRVKKSTRNAIYGLISKLVTIVLQFVSRYFFIMYLGNELLGVGGVFTNIIQCLSLAELGMSTVVAFSYYKPLAKQDYEKLNALNCFYKKVYLIIAIFVTIIGLSIIPFLNFIINVETPIDNLIIIYLFYLADTVASYLFIYKTTIISADQKANIASKIDIAVQLVVTVLQILALVIFKQFLIYLGISIVFNVISNCIKALYVKKHYPQLKGKSQLPKEDKAVIYKTIRSGFVYKLSAVLLNSTDNLLISMIVGTAAVGLLSNYVTIITSVSAFITIIFNGITASVGNLVVTETEEKQFEIFKIMIVAANCFAMVFFGCTFLLSDDFIVLWIGEQFLLDKWSMAAKVAMLYLSCILQPIFVFREAFALYKKTKYMMLAAALINIGLSIGFGFWLGTKGILIASLIAMFSTYFWYEPKLLLNEKMKVSQRWYWTKTAVNALVTGTLVTGLYFLLRLIPTTNWGFWILKGAISFTVLALGAFALYNKTYEFKYLKNRVLKRNDE